METNTNTDGRLAMPDIEACVRTLQTSILMGRGARRAMAIRVWLHLGYPVFWSECSMVCP